MQKSLEEILETILKADERGESSITDISAHCSIAVTEDDLNVMEKKGLIQREGHRLLLTNEGRNEARGVVRRHRLAETLFATVLNLDAQKRELIACEVEHCLLPEVEEAICTLLGHPTICPDGKPIPPGPCCNAKRSMTPSVIVNLTALRPGEKGRITYIKPKDHDRLHRLTSFGLTPGIVVEVHQNSPVFCLRYEGTELALNSDVAEDVFVARVR